MKKLFLLFIIIIILVSSEAFAGSVDMDLIAQDDAKVFLGKLSDFAVTYREDDYINTVCSVKIMPTEKIKGEVSTEKTLEFDNVSFGKITPKKDEAYFFGVLGKEVYVWELEAYDTLLEWEKDEYTKEDIILKERHNSSIAEGIQKLLNDGTFVRAEKERQTLTEKAQENTDTNIYHVIFAAILTALVLALMVYRLAKVKR